MAQAVEAALGRGVQRGGARRTGSALRGLESAGLLKKKFHSVLAPGLGLLAGRGWMLRKRPPAYWGAIGVAADGSLKERGLGHGSDVGK
jgi:hypothetical protein